MVPRVVFLVSGTKEHWLLAKQKRNLFWGLPRAGKSWNECRATLQEVGFGSAAEIVACAGPFAFFRAVVDGDVYYDDTPVWTYGRRGKQLWPIRFRFTRVTDVNTNWYTRQDNWRLVLRDVYLGQKSVFVPRDDALAKPFVLSTVLFHPLVNPPSSAAPSQAKPET